MVLCFLCFSCVYVVYLTVYFGLSSLFTSVEKCCA